jgi:tetratricopeptide (TPR) repeat protein
MDNLGIGQAAESNRALKDVVQYERDHPLRGCSPRPSSELLGDMLLKIGRPAEALQAYKVALQMAPNRLDSLKGAQASAEKSGQEKLAGRYAEKIAISRGTTALEPSH